MNFLGVGPLEVALVAIVAVIVITVPNAVNYIQEHGTTDDDA